MKDTQNKVNNTYCWTIKGYNIITQFKIFKFKMFKYIIVQISYYKINTYKHIINMPPYGFFFNARFLVSVHSEIVEFTYKLISILLFNKL